MCGPQELAPQVALQQLALALDHPMRHTCGMCNLQRILWQDAQPVWEFPTLHMDRSAYLQEACRHMTAAEQVRRQTWMLGFIHVVHGDCVEGDECDVHRSRGMPA